MNKTILTVLSVLILPVTRQQAYASNAQILENLETTVEVQSAGRLGNQLFEYWTGKIYAQKHKKTLFLSDFKELYASFDIPEKKSNDIAGIYSNLPKEKQKR